MKKDKKEIKNITKKGLAVLLAGTMIGTMFAGCSKNAYLTDTDLENAMVMIIDDETLVVESVGGHFYGGIQGYRCSDKHYKDVITGNLYHVSPYTSKEVSASSDEQGCSVEEIKRYLSCGDEECVSLLDDEVQLIALSNKLTADELKKAKEGKFTDEDFVALEQRMAEETKTLK